MSGVVAADQTEVQPGRDGCVEELEEPQETPGSGAVGNAGAITDPLATPSAANKLVVPHGTRVAGVSIPCRKLVRDRIPEIIQSEGRCPFTHVLDDVSYQEALLAKLVEEAGEVTHATALNLPGELADVLEVLRALTVTAGISWEQLLALADDKRNRRGGFEKRIFLESVE